MVHFLSCDLILLVSVKVAFDLENLQIAPQVFLLLHASVSEFSQSTSKHASYIKTSWYTTACFFGL